MDAALEVDKDVFEVDMLDVGNKGFLIRRVYEIAHFLLILLFLFHSDNVTADTMDTSLEAVARNNNSDNCDGKDGVDIVDDLVSNYFQNFRI